MKEKFLTRVQERETVWNEGENREESNTKSGANARGVTKRK